MTSSSAFSSESLKQKYLQLLGAAQIGVKDVTGGTPALADYGSKSIIFFHEALKVRTYRDGAVTESHGGTVERIARILTHEIRHLTNANHDIPQSESRGWENLMDSDSHDASPREIDADNFEQKIWDNQGGQINDF